MRGLWFLVFFLFFFIQVHCWDKYDYEIFDLVSELEAIEGKGTSFYAFLGVEPTASTAEIAKAYRKKSLLLHPDKNPGVKGAHERFSKLGIISSILRNPERRPRYDFFYKNGVPQWRGTGYYYSRFRPGLGTAVTFLILLTSGLQYLVQSMNYRTDLARIERFAAKARLAAWGPKLVPIEGKRKVKVNLRGDAYHEDDPNGKWIEMVVDGNGVYLIDSDGQLLPLNASVAEPAAITRTWFVSSIGLLYQRIRYGSQTLNEEDEKTGDDSNNDDAEPEDEKVTKKSKRISQRNGIKSSSTSTSRTGSARRR